MTTNEKISATGSTWFILEIARLKALCAHAASVLEDEFGSPENPAYGHPGPVHELIAKLKKTAAE